MFLHWFFFFLHLEIWVSFVGFLSFAYVLGLWFMFFVCCIWSCVFVLNHVFVACIGYLVYSFYQVHWV
jgi:hypothetical protein